MESKESRPRHERWVDLEVRIFCGGADQHDQPLLHCGKKGVLLGLIEPVNLIEEQDRAGPAFTETLA